MHSVLNCSLSQVIVFDCIAAVHFIWILVIKIILYFELVFTFK